MCLCNDLILQRWCKGRKMKNFFKIYFWKSVELWFFLPRPPLWTAQFPHYPVLNPMPTVIVSWLSSLRKLWHTCHSWKIDLGDGWFLVLGHVLGLNRSPGPEAACLSECVGQRREGDRAVTRPGKRIHRKKPAARRNGSLSTVFKQEGGSCHFVGWGWW